MLINVMKLEARFQNTPQNLYLKNQSKSRSIYRTLGKVDEIAAMSRSDNDKAWPIPPDVRTLYLRIRDRYYRGLGQLSNLREGFIRLLI